MLSAHAAVRCDRIRTDDRMLLHPLLVLDQATPAVTMASVRKPANMPTKRPVRLKNLSLGTEAEVLTPLPCREHRSDSRTEVFEPTGYRDTRLHTDSENAQTIASGTFQTGEPKFWAPYVGSCPLSSALRRQRSVDQWTR
jgi:hypothetical protein